MINSWLALPFQVTRLGWETQTLLMDRWLQLAGMNSDRKAAAESPTVEELAPKIAEEPLPEEVQTPAEAILPVVHTAPSSKVRHVAQKVSKIHKKQAIRNKHGRSK